MISLQDIVSRFADRPLFLGSSGETSYAAFLEQVERERHRFSAGGKVAVPMDWSADAFARLCAALMEADCIFPGNGFPEGNLQPFLENSPLLILQTGGSTGQPRHAVHSVKTFLEKYRIQAKPSQRQLLLYSAGHVAGLDAFFHAVHRGATLVIPERRDPESLAAAIERYRVEILAATPTQLQFLLMADAFRGKDLGSVNCIPYGAEAMSVALRQRLSEAFPQARLLQRFGMTELGALPVSEDSSDPRALYLEAANHTWKVENGELHIWAPGRMLGTLEAGPLDPEDPWFRTGDLAERTGNGSIRILGRREQLINVGGEKVIPSIVEELLREHADILDAQVYAMPNPMTGEAVAARIVCPGKTELLEILSDIRVSARKRGMSLASVPTRIEYVDRLEMTPSGKRKPFLQA